MHLTLQHRHDFEELGFALVDDVLSEPEARAGADAMDGMYTGEKRTGIIWPVTEPGLFDVFQHPHLEQIAQYVLGAEEVVLAGTASLFARPSPPGTPWKMYGEHVDIMHSLEELDATPKRMMCIVMVFLSDLPEGRANTMVRLGSHRMLAHHLAEHGQPPIKAQPTNFGDLPPLDWPSPVPVVARRGQAAAFNTCVIHAGSSNITDEPRRMLFVNFCPKGMRKEATPNHDLHPQLAAYRKHLHEAFRPERRYLVE